MKPRHRLAVLCLGGSLAVTGCSNMSQNEWLNQENVGTVVGAAAGILIGSQIGGGSGRTAAMLAGALAGGALGKTLGAKLDQRDREALAVQTQKALEHAQDGQVTTWTSDHSGATARIVPVATETEARQVAVKRTPKVQKVEQLTLLNKPYQSIKSANLRAAPNDNAAKVGGLPTGTRLTALGRTGNDWIAVGRKGVTIGYVYAPLVTPATTATVATAGKTKAQPAPAVDLDTLDVASAKQQGVDLDAADLDAAPVQDKVAAKTTCRTLNYSLSQGGQQDQQTTKACQAADGAWELI